MADAKQGKTPLEDFHNGSQSRMVLAKPRLGGFGSSGFASSSNKPCNPFGSVLRPSQLKPGSNPFLKLTETPDTASDKEQEKESTSEERLTENKEEEEAPKFVPLGSANVTPRTTNPVPAPAQPTSSSSSGFVFGQNLSERVVMKEHVNNGDETLNNRDETLNNGDVAPSDHSSSNGTSELLFTAAAQATVKENNQDEPGPSEPATASGPGLAAAAAEYERSHRPPPLSAASSYNITTGEEDEINVLQMSCRLFAWEAGTWRERGRSVLRLNDSRAANNAGGGQTSSSARLVIRARGSLRVVVNTPLWRGMVAQRAGNQALRITAATDNSNVKLFLIMGAPADINQLYRALTSRIAVSKDCAQTNTSQQAAERLEAATDDTEFDKHGDDTDDKTDRLEQKTEDKSDEDDIDDKAKPLKRKEPADNDTPPKRQCSDVLTD